MGSVSNVTPVGLPRPLSIGQTQARVRMVTTPSRIVAHALDLSPFPRADGKQSMGEGRENLWLRGAVQQVIAQFRLPNRVSWNQMQVDDGKDNADMGSTVVGQSEKLAIAWSSIQQALLSHMGGTWFSKGHDQKAGVIDGMDAQSDAVSASDILKELAEGQDTVDALAGSQKEPQEKPQPPDIWRFLKPVPLSEAKVVKVMASLSDLVYSVAKVNPSSLFRRHKMWLVASSLSCKEVTSDAAKVEDAIAHGDGMGVGNELNGTMNDIAMGKEMSNIVVATSDDETDDGGDGGAHAGIHVQSTKPLWFGTRKVAAKMAQGVSTAANGIYSKAMAQLAWQVYQAMVAGHTAVNLTVAQVLSLVQAALSFGISRGQENQSSKTDKCPTEWFVCDHHETNTRIFCIQGSDNFESWQTNLTFDPTVFEDEGLGIRIHRGVYEVAKKLYGLFAPLVTEHIHKNPGAKISMTGHSLGGSLATALILMLVHRGVLPAENVGTVYGFGVAACFCDAAACGGDCADCAHACPLKPDDGTSRTVSQGLLEKLNLDSNCIINVVMNRDIVPRAFACDYNPVAGILRNVGPGFREHCCLQHERALLYNFLGDVLLLQPDIGKTYVKEEEGYHPQLPQGAGLFRITENTEGLKESTEWKRTGPVGDQVSSRREAVLSFMDNPHPLEILGDAGAYGEFGAISRYHNPLHYKTAIGTVISILKKKNTGHFDAIAESDATML